VGDAATLAVVVGVGDGLEVLVATGVVATGPVVSFITATASPTTMSTATAPAPTSAGALRYHGVACSGGGAAA
jgi:hypothetical protein